MKFSEKDWVITGRWMLISSGLVLLMVAFYWEKDVISLILRVWSGLFGLLCIYLGLFK